MANTADITLTNALAATIGDYLGRESDTKFDTMRATPYLRLLKERGRVFESDIFKVGANIFDQSFGSSTYVDSLTVSATNEFIKMPTYYEYNFGGVQKKIILTKEEVRLLKETLNIVKDGGLKDKKRSGFIRKNVRNLREKTFLGHIRKMFMDMNTSLINTTAGCNAKALDDVIDPVTGPNATFASSAVDLTALDVKVNQPLWVKASGGTGATGLGATLTGGTMNYANSLMWLSKMQTVQSFRNGGDYNALLVSPTVRDFLAHLAENRIQYQLDPHVSLVRHDPKVVVGKGGIPLDSYKSLVTVNGLPVVADPAVNDNYWWVLNTDCIELSTFDDQAMLDEYYVKDSPVMTEEAMIRVFARMCATTTSRWSDEAIVAMMGYYQQSFNDFSGIGLIVMDATSTT